MAPAKPQKSRFALLCLGFAICGAVTVLPGPLLPLLAARWHLADVESGTFFAVQFAASTVGAILSPRQLRRNLPAGYAMMAAGVLLLAVATGMGGAAVGHGLALTAFGFVGFGFGLSVTATNLTVGAAGNSGAGEERARRLSVVNLWWGAGAVGCPWIVAAAERSGELLLLLVVVAAAAMAMFGLLVRRRGDAEEGARPGARREASGEEMRTLVFFAGFLFLYVGVENAVGGWIATYGHRFSGMTLAAASLVVSVYWLALLGGRGLGSVALRRWPERAVLLPSVVLAFAAVGALMMRQSPAVFFIAVAAAGAGFGPVFPVGVSRMLGRLNDHRKTGWVFAMCAAGGAVLPWLTGLVSTGSGSLRIGFAVPVGAVGAILALALAENGVLHEPAPVQPAREKV